MIESMQQSIKKTGNLYGSTVAELQEQAIGHLYRWSPKQHKALMKSKRLHSVTKKAAEMALREINSLMAAGFQKHEAEEMVLPEYILTKPETDLIAKIEADEA